MADDITILYITANEVPPRWAAFQMGHLLKAAGDSPIISVSRTSMTLGTNLLDTDPKSYWNIYASILRACHVATTPYVGIAEDDTLYSFEHFHEFRPPLDTVAFDMAWWSLLSWDPLFSIREHRTNATVIAPRLLMIEALEERKAKHPNGLPDKLVGEVGRESVERRMGVTVHKSVNWLCHNPIVRMDHPTGTDTGRQVRASDGRRMRKIHKPMKAIEIPYWGRAEDLARIYNEP